ncbi:MAG: ATP-binding cassette domain-containing protein, partial [SAR324 cluster bacterium]|nr:ATP-binding cassette domain-containing protein [SAR324 cluster bacterium]
MSYLLGENLIGGYGTGDILKGCTISAERGEISVVVGPNGAGKSTAMKAMLGMLKVLKGKVTLAEQDITIMSPQQRVQLGMAFVPQTNNVFSSMTVEENLERGAFIRTDQIADSIAQVYDIFPILKDKRKQPA